MKVIIAGHTFDGSPVFNAGYNRRGIGFVVPLDTEDSVIEDLKNATKLEVLNNKNELIATYRLCDWIGIERIFCGGDHNGIAITWNTVTLDEVDDLKNKITDLKNENQNLTDENTMLTDALLELAEIIGGEDKA